MAVRLVVRAPFAADASAELAFEFDQTRILIGRGASADVRLPHAAVSESHAALRLDGSTYALVDEGSTNGTRVNGARLVSGRAKALRSGDVIDIAGFLVTFHAGVATTLPTSSEQTAALARRLVREVLDPHGAASEPTRLVVVGGPQAGARVELPPPPARLLVGRGETCDLVLLDADCSREHVELIRDLDGTLARDLGAKNGTRINDKPLRERRLRDRDELLIGQTVVVYEDPAEAALRALEGVPDAPVPDAKSDEPAPHPSPLPGAEWGKITGEESDKIVDGGAPHPSPLPEGERGKMAEGAERPSAHGSAPGPSSMPTPMPTRAEVPRDRRRPTGVSADVVIYVLAGVVLAASAVALFVLLRAG